MSLAPEPSLHQRVTDALLTVDPAQRIRVAQAGLALAVMLLGVVLLTYAARVGGTSLDAVLAWAALSLGGALGFFVAIRSGWSRRLADPSLTLAQMIFAIASCAAAYTLAGPLRGASFSALLVIIMFGMFQLRPRTVMLVCLYAGALFGVLMALMAWRHPLAYPPVVELGHFLLLAAMLPVVALLAARVTRQRERSRGRRHELAQALARIQELATRDDLTGLVNRRQMVFLLEQEHQRCVRSGRTFCLALIDVDHFKQINDGYGHAAGDEVLRGLAREAKPAIRVADVLARWGGEEFVLLLSDTQLPQARGGVERLRQRIETATLLVAHPSLHVTVSAGLVEHIAGESVAQSLDRADRALYQAKAQGRNRTVVATLATAHG